MLEYITTGIGYLYLIGVFGVVSNYVYMMLLSVCKFVYKGLLRIYLSTKSYIESLWIKYFTNWEVVESCTYCGEQACYNYSGLDKETLNIKFKKFIGEPVLVRREDGQVDIRYPLILEKLIENEEKAYLYFSKTDEKYAKRMFECLNKTCNKENEILEKERDVSVVRWCDERYLFKNLKLRCRYLEELFIDYHRDIYVIKEGEVFGMLEILIDLYTDCYYEPIMPTLTNPLETQIKYWKPIDSPEYKTDLILTIGGIMVSTLVSVALFLLS